MTTKRPWVGFLWISEAYREVLRCQNDDIYITYRNNHKYDLKYIIYVWNEKKINIFVFHFASIFEGVQYVFADAFFLIQFARTNNKLLITKTRRPLLYWCLFGTA